MSLLNLGFTQEKTGDGAAEEQRKQSAYGQLLQMKDCGMRIQHKLKERATTELKEGYSSQALR